MVTELGKKWSSLGDLFNLLGIERGHIVHEDQLLFRHLKLKPGENVWVGGEKCRNIYFVFSGFLKNTWVGKNGFKKIINFPMKNEIVGLEGIADGVHINILTTITDCELIAIPIEFLCRQEQGSNTLWQKLILVMSQQIINEQKVSTVTTSFPAPIRVVKFILNLSSKHEALGFSGKSFMLRMTQDEIGSYLGVTNETVSRAMSELSELGYIKKKYRHIEIFDFSALRKLERIPDTMIDSASSPKKSSYGLLR